MNAIEEIRPVTLLSYRIHVTRSIANFVTSFRHIPANERLEACRGNDAETRNSLPIIKRNYPRSFCNRGRPVGRSVNRSGPVTTVSNYNNNYANHSVSRQSHMIGPLRMKNRNALSAATRTGNARPVARYAISRRAPPENLFVPHFA